MTDLGNTSNHDQIPETLKEEFPNSLLNNNYPIIGNLPLTRFKIYKLISNHLYDWLYEKIEIEPTVETRKIQNLKNGSDFEPKFETTISAISRKLTHSQIHSKKDSYVTNIILAITELTAYSLTMGMPVGSAAYTKNKTEGKHDLKTGYDTYYNDLKYIDNIVSKFEAEDGQKVFHPEIEKDIEKLRSTVTDLLDSYKTAAKMYKENIFSAVIRFYNMSDIDVSELGQILELTLEFFEKSKYIVFKSSNDVIKELQDHLSRYREIGNTRKEVSQITYEHLYDLLSRLEQLDPQQKMTEEILKCLRYANDRLTVKKTLSGATSQDNVVKPLPLGSSGMI